VRIGKQQYRDIFGRFPEGIWFPECGFAQGFDDYIGEEGFRYFFLEAHGVIRGEPFPQFGVHLPIICKSGVVAFGRDQKASGQVWSSQGGYPGDPLYRDFYRDAGFDIDEDHIRHFLSPYGAKTYTGLKYYRVTGGSGPKEPYQFKIAQKRAGQHAAHFLAERVAQITGLYDRFGIRPVITAIFDAELLGHWWFEGPNWLEMLLRAADKNRVIRLITPPEYLDRRQCISHLQMIHPAASSWGEKGYHEVWLNEKNDDIYRHLLKATGRMVDLAERFPSAGGLIRRALNQSARELLLSQQSDWTFMMKNDAYADYARRRFTVHIGRFTRLYESIVSGDIREEMLQDIEERDRIFPAIDYRVYRRKS
jgi:1,4-alpha-glucan branching enzyme